MVIEEHAKLEITLPDGRFFVISEGDIIQNSLSVTSQCVNGNTFGFGCVSPAQLSAKIRIKSAEISRYDVYGAEIILYSWFDEEPPEDGGKRGVFNVTSVTKNHDIFTISASDNVCWLDSSAFTDNNEKNNLGNAIYDRLQGGFWTAMDILGIIIEDFWKENAFYFTPSNAEMIPNARPKFNGYDIENDYEVRLPLLLSGEESDNVRDYVSWLAEYMGGFIRADENGKIQFCLFENSFYHQPEILDFSNFQQDSLEIAGFRIYLYSAKLITEEKAWRSCEYYGKNGENSVIDVETVLQNNPFVEYIYKSNAGDMFPIVEALYRYQIHIQIRPFSGIYHGKQYLHLGQYIRIMDENGVGHDTTITNITWKFRGGQQIKCVGEDSRTLSQARKRTQAVRMGERMKTQINRLESKVNENIGNSDTEFKNIEEKMVSIDGYLDEHNNRLNELESKDFQSQIDNLRARIESLENGGRE